MRFHSIKKDGKINDIDYPGEIADYNALYSWVSDQCIKLVREITFENAEVFQAIDFDDFFL
jgi:hypothetical protein